MTFFDFPGIPQGMHGTDEIYRTAFRVPSDEALNYWVERFDRLNVKHEGIQEQFGVKVISFIDFDDQKYQLISDENNEGIASGKPWQDGPVPLEYAITGLGPVHMRVSNFGHMKEVLEKVLLFKEISQDGDFHLFEVGEGGNGAQVIIEQEIDLPTGRQGYGTVHHVAFRVEDRAVLDEWTKRIESFGFQTSGFVDRFFFGSLYSRMAPGILFEFATDGPGFMGDEPYETLGEKLSLPPFLEPKREQIEKLVRPIDTVRSTIDFVKE